MARIFKDSNAIDSLRNSDFDAVSAYGEVVDNSIQANAKNINIRSFLNTSQGRYPRFERLVFGDDGHGMGESVIANCLTIGWSSRYNERDGIGRFGVGMTLAAIHECKRVEVYSRTAGGEWLYVFLDLDDVAAGNGDELAPPIKRKPGKDISDLSGEHHGTIVVWSKYDRQGESAKKLLEESLHWMGRTYRYFIWEDDVTIKIDDELVKAIDPLYVRLEKTQFPYDKPGNRFESQLFQWPVDEYDAPAGAPAESTIRIEMSLLPEYLRKNSGDGGAEAARKRHIDENEGVSILRNRREVFYGHIPHWKAAGPGWPAFEDIDRWWGCEIHFDAVLDRAFTVKNIKRGAVPSKQLKENIKRLIQPTREHCLDVVRKLWQESKQKAKVESTEADGDGVRRLGDHKRAEDVAKGTTLAKSRIDEGKNLDQELDAYVTNLGNQYDAEQKAALKAIFASQPFSIMEQCWTGPQFFESHFLGGKAVLDYNMQHVFFQRVYGILADLESDGDGHKAAAALKDLVDLLIIAYAKAEASFGSEDEMDAKSFLEMLRSNWGQYLVSYVKRWTKNEEQI
jgi:hypothetical protein